MRADSNELLPDPTLPMMQTNEPFLILISISFRQTMLSSFLYFFNSASFFCFFSSSSLNRVTVF